MNEILSITKLSSNKSYVQILDKDTVWDTVYTDRVFDRVMHPNITEPNTGLDTILVNRVINRVM